MRSFATSIGTSRALCRIFWREPSYIFVATLVVSSEHVVWRWLVALH